MLHTTKISQNANSRLASHSQLLQFSDTVTVTPKSESLPLQSRLYKQMSKQILTYVFYYVYMYNRKEKSQCAISYHLNPLSH